jgi:hypothetical protein
MRRLAGATTRTSIRGHSGTLAHAIDLARDGNPNLWCKLQTAWVCGVHLVQGVFVNAGAAKWALARSRNIYASDVSFENPPGSIQSEPIQPPNQPDALMLDRLHESFRAQPRIIEAYLVGEHLTPEDGSPEWDASRIVLLLDPPLDASSPETLRREIDALVDGLKGTSWEREPDRTWSFSTTTRSWRIPKPDGQPLYKKPAAD